MPDWPYPDPRDDADPDGDDLPYDRIELDKIPRRLWEQTLAPLHRQHRTWIVSRMHDERLKDIAGEIAFELDLARAAASTGLPPTTLARALVLNGVTQMLRDGAT